jgi:hypothetical protein
MDSAVEALTDRTLEDIWVGKSYSESSVGKLGCFQSYGYERLMRYYNGDRDDVRLNQRLRDHISSKVRWTDMQTQSRLGQGTIQPVMLSFPTNETVYPLKISSVNKGQSEILIYVFGKHKASADGFSIEYADWVGIDDVRGRKYLGELLDDRYFLTKMRRAMWPNEMKEDVIIGDAVNDLSELPVDYEAGFSTKWALYIAALAAAYVAISIINLPLAVVLNILSKMTARTRLGVKPMLYPIYALPLPVMLFIVSLLGQLTDSSIPYKVANLPVALSYQLMHLFGMPSWASWVLMFAVASLASFALVHALITLAGHWWAKRGPRNATVA